MMVFCYIIYEVKNLLVFFLFVLDGLLLCGFIFYFDKFKMVYDYLFVFFCICILKKKYEKVNGEKMIYNFVNVLVILGNVDNYCCIIFIF